MHGQENHIDMREDYTWFLTRAHSKTSRFNGFMVVEETERIRHLRNADGIFFLIGVDATITGKFPIGGVVEDCTFIAFPATREGFRKAYRVARCLVKTGRASMPKIGAPDVFVQPSIYHQIH